MRAVAGVMAFLIAAVAAPAGQPTAPAFAKRPTLTIAGGKTVVSFAADRETDVAVYVEDANGKIVRHLAAGVLGTNAPAPLTSGTLEQNIPWDGKDDFGRVFAPDTGRFRVAVLDSNGNEIANFGACGNQDCCGPESYVLDPREKVLRPRRADDPKELVSPFAKPEIAFGWIVGLAVTDRNAYIDDVINKRVLRVRLEYAVEQMCEIR
jgi:hypothetical protein